MRACVLAVNVRKRNYSPPYHTTHKKKNMPPLKTFGTHDFQRPSTLAAPASSSSTGQQTATPTNNNNTTATTNNGLLVTASTNSNKKPFFNEQYAQKLLENLNQLRTEARFCDVEIIAGNTVFNVHRAVLSASSAYFEAMFRPVTSLCEGTQKSVVLHSIDPDILKMLLDFIYTGRIDIRQCNVQELLAAADMLQITEIVEGCCDFLCRELHASNALGILRFAEAHHCEPLAESAQTFIYTNFPVVALEDEMLDTPQTLLSRILTSEWLRVDSESQVFQAALRWIKHDVLQRRQFVFDILAHIRLALVPLALIDQAAGECKDVSLKVALRSVRKDLSSKRGQLVPLRVCPRISAKKYIYIFGGVRRETSSGWNPEDYIFDSVAKFDIFRREWMETAPMKIGRIQPGCAKLGGKIFVIGGEKGSQILANGEMYDPQNNTWNWVSPMIVPRCEFGLCALGGTLWAVGGWIGVDIGGSMECYDPVKDVWTHIGEMPEPRFSMGVVSFEGLIYVVGGCTTSSRHLADLISYNPITQDWTYLAPMQTARCQLGVAILDRYLYVVGGNDQHQDVLRTIERYSFDDNKWEVMSPMHVNRASPAVAAADGLLYVAGGDQVRFGCETFGILL